MDLDQTDEIVLKIGEKMGVPVQKSDISISHRIPSRKHLTDEGNPIPPAIIVKKTISKKLIFSRTYLEFDGCHSNTQNDGHDWHIKNFVENEWRTTESPLEKTRLFKTLRPPLPQYARELTWVQRRIEMQYMESMNEAHPYYFISYSITV